MRQAGKYSGFMMCGGIAGRTGPHSLPLARIKKIMKKSGEDVKMISGEAPIVFSKACELFIEELTRRSWATTLQGKRRTLHKDDVASAIVATDIFDFLVSMVSETASHSEDGTVPEEEETVGSS
ncbi:putative transcription factor Hap3/NF-YB family [Rosa chinensis]|uniref:Putative transcription factor Hap3/NF-YB family n=1 Tax=Rosa chinensis TaxID=74649 RepID=A0A2P6P754_ROSCH|nr:nuclear transcription factor Y subunit C-9 [Rosa chinensis]PRQ17750.1 putative transcription factor Hap3/NF-YB family [Rosa chinensis]